MRDMKLHSSMFSVIHGSMVVAAVTLGIWLVGVPAASAGKLTTAFKVSREVSEQLGKRIVRLSGKRVTREMAEESAEVLVKQYGRHADDVVRLYGKAGLELLEQGGKGAGIRYADNILRYGDDALRLGRTAAGRKVLSDGSELVVKAAAKQGDHVLPLTREFGDDAAAALIKVNRKNAAELVQMRRTGKMSKADFRKMLHWVAGEGDEAVEVVLKQPSKWKNVAFGTAAVGVAAASGGAYAGYRYLDYRMGVELAALKNGSWGTNAYRDMSSSSAWSRSVADALSSRVILVAVLWGLFWLGRHLFESRHFIF